MSFPLLEIFESDTFLIFQVIGICSPWICINKILSCGFKHELLFFNYLIAMYR